MTATKELDTIAIYEQAKREQVTPKLELLRSEEIGGNCPNEVIFRGVRGGRWAGAKSTSCVSLLVQESNYYPHRVACLREVQNSLEESVFPLVVETIERLNYKGWKITDEYIDSPVGAHWIFRGLKDRRSIASIKGLQGFTRFFIDEAAYISESSIDVIIPTLFRNPGAQLWFAYNQESDYDPITIKVWNPYLNNSTARLIDCEPVNIDNPWLTLEAINIANKLKEDDPDLWEYVYGGKPRTQGENSVLSRADIRRASERIIDNPVGIYQIGVDVARFGDDYTVMYKRHGLKTIERRAWRGQDTMKTAKEAWALANNIPSIPIVVDDTGVGGGVSDRLKEYGAKVIMFHSNGRASDQDKYADAITEAWFEFPIHEADIPDDPELRRQLEGRQYDFVRGKMQRIVESKKDYKKRLMRSPDDADALLMTYYEGKGMRISDVTKQALAKRRHRG